MVTKELLENWKFRKKGSDQWVPATVPGCIHTDLLVNNLIPDPFTGLNELSLQWIDKEEWEYHCSFEVSSYLLDHDQLEIWFYGVDTFAEILLNGTVILHTNNMFHPWSADVKKLLHEGENTLDVRFSSPYAKGLEKYKNLPYQLPAANDRGEFKLSPFFRKAAYHFGWDWAPRFLTSGLWKNIELLAWNKLKIRDFFISQKSQEKDHASLSCELELEIHSAGEYIFSIYVDKDLISTGKYRLVTGINNFSLPIDIYNPKLWYPRGYGSPDVYKITIDVKDENIILDTRQTTTGIRTVELITNGQDIGSDFYFKVNGLSVFARGANITPMDVFLPRIKKADYKSLVDNAVSANMNMLRVWGGGIYENDCFYNLCNQEGIMVWQDFMFACMMYPSDNSFLASVQKELDYTVKRLRNHPSVVLWCGNNEILEGFHSWGWKEKLGKFADEAFDSYKRLFYEIIPGTLKRLDPSRPYHSSSPSTPQRTVPDMHSGDYHFWDIIKQPLALSSYESNIGCFMSEFGFKSYPESKTINAYAGVLDSDIHSEVHELHQGWKGGAELVERHCMDLYGKHEGFNDFLYLSQLTQKEAIKMAIESHRRAKPACMGSLLWQLNDCWPCASWSAVDYFGRWKALMYELRHLFADTIISPVIKNNQLQVFVISDLVNPPVMTASLRVMTFEGFEVFNKEFEFQPDSLSAEMIFSVSIDKLNIARIANQVVLVSEIFENKKRVDRNLTYFVKPQDMLLKQAIPKIEFTSDGNKTILVLNSPVLLKDVYLENHQSEGFFSDNYFDLLPGETKPVLFQSDSMVSGGDGVSVKTLNSLFL